jgi:TRAP-type C4-dicarboxylate transport system substrate-binding protein
MPKMESISTRAPRGTKPVMAAFFTALDATPEASRAAIAKAAQVMIRDELKMRREKVKAAAEKLKLRKPVVVKPVVKAAKIVAAPVAKAGRARKAA